MRGADASEALTPLQCLLMILKDNYVAAMMDTKKPPLQMPSQAANNDTRSKDFAKGKFESTL